MFKDYHLTNAAFLAISHQPSAISFYDEIANGEPA